MRRAFFSVLVLLCLLCPPLALFASDKPPTADARQLVLVISPEWNASQGVLARFERAAPDQPWQRIGKARPVVLGKYGMGWGLGLHDSPGWGIAPRVREGSKRSPAGVFTLPLAFGYVPHWDFPVKLPYVRRTEHIVGVDDPKSSYYNTFVDKRRIPDPDWSPETEAGVGRFVPRFEFGVMLGHNVNPPLPGMGSMFHIHVALPKDTHTAGCTALDRKAIRSLALWLDPEKHPLAVQLPLPEYLRLKTAWNLPDLPWP